MFDLSTAAAAGPDAWRFAALALAAAGIGFSKAGFPGVSMLHVVVFALAFGTKASTGILLPLLIVGDLCAITGFGRRGRLDHIRRLLPPALIGIGLGALALRFVPTEPFRYIVAGMILTLAAVQAYRMRHPSFAAEAVRHPAFAWTLGIAAGTTTMMANAAGPIAALYLLAVSLPKYELIGTSAWLFLSLNLIKVPVSTSLGLMNASTLFIDLQLMAFVPIGLVAGRWVVQRISQRTFDVLLLAFTAVMAVRLAVG